MLAKFLGYLDFLIYRLRGLVAPKHKREEWELRVRELYATRVGLKKNRTDTDQQVLSYEHDGKFDYELYKEIQTLGNKGKIERVTVTAENIAYLVRHLEKIIPSIDFVLCHGTRNAAEQKFFQAALSKPATLLGTEISDTAKNFPMTVEWDFHEVKPEWLGAADVIYSNSFDHSYDPDKLFKAWLSCLKPGGVMALEWAFQSHAVTRPQILDPFKIEFDGLQALLRSYCKDGNYELLEPLREPPNRRLGEIFALVRRVK
jgi:hypothetical protein